MRDILLSNDVPLTEAEVEHIFAKWVKRLRLRHWQFDLCFDQRPTKDGQEAEILMPADYDYGQVLFAENWPNWSNELVNEVLVHELIHAHLHKIHVAGLEGKNGYSPEAAKLYVRRFIHEIERTTDSLTVTLIEQLGNV
jgi:hypothetical protein